MIRLLTFTVLLAGYATLHAQEPYAFDYPYLIVEDGKVTVTDSDGQSVVLEQEEKIPSEDADDAKIPSPEALLVHAVAPGSRIEVAERTDGKRRNSQRNAGYLYSKDLGQIIIPEGSVAELVKAGKDREKPPAEALKAIKGILHFDLDSKVLRNGSPAKEFRLSLPKHILAVKGTTFGTLDTVGGTIVMMESGQVDVLSQTDKTLQQLGTTGLNKTIYIIDEKGKVAAKSSWNGVEPGADDFEARAFELAPELPRQGFSVNHLYYSNRRDFYPINLKEHALSITSSEHAKIKTVRNPDYFKVETPKQGADQLTFKFTKPKDNERRIFLLNTEIELDRRLKLPVSVQQIGILFQASCTRPLNMRADGSFGISRINSSSEYSAVASQSRQLQITKKGDWQACCLPINVGSDYNGSNESLSLQIHIFCESGKDSRLDSKEQNENLTEFTLELRNVVVIY